MKETDKLIASTLKKTKPRSWPANKSGTHTQFTSCTNSLVLELAFLWP